MDYFFIFKYDKVFLYFCIKYSILKIQLNNIYQE